ncbi:MAG TPA: 2Fe-2S iron-sulfur cluster-binding protein [Longimicrobiales bacterium]|jgi:isoquinoline 1-oxidoreductase alpha subunit
MARVGVTINGTEHSVEADSDTPLLWVLRDLLGLTGTKYGCGAGLCGSCTVLWGDAPTRSCQVTLAAAEGGSFTTIEGLPPLEEDPVRQAWLAEDVSQCGYCQPGMIVRARSLLRDTPDPDDADIDAALAGHVCRCGSYSRIRRAIHRAAAATRSSGSGGAP